MRERRRPIKAAFTVYRDFLNDDLSKEDLKFMEDLARRMGKQYKTSEGVARGEFSVKEIKLAQYLLKLAKKKGVSDREIFIRPLREFYGRDTVDGLWLSAETGMLYKCFGLVPVDEAWSTSYTGRLSQSVQEKLQKLKLFRDVAVEPYDSGTILLYIE